MGIKDIYKSIDKSLGGYLPGGITPQQAKSKSSYVINVGPTPAGYTKTTEGTLVSTPGTPASTGVQKALIPSSTPVVSSGRGGGGSSYVAPMSTEQGSVLVDSSGQIVGSAQIPQTTVPGLSITTPQSQQSQINLPYQTRGTSMNIPQFNVKLIQDPLTQQKYLNDIAKGYSQSQISLPYQTRGTFNQQPTTQFYQDYESPTNVEFITGVGKAVGKGVVKGAVVGGVNLLSYGTEKAYETIYKTPKEQTYKPEGKYTLTEPTGQVSPYQERGTAGAEYKPLFEIISPISEKMIRETTPYEKLKGTIGDLFPGITIPTKQELKETFGVRNIAETSGELWRGWDLLAEKTGEAWEGISEKIGLGKIKVEAGSYPIGKKETIIDYNVGKKDVSLVEPLLKTSYGKDSNLITLNPLGKEYSPVQKDNVFKRIDMDKEIQIPKIIGTGAKEYVRFAPWLIGGTTKAGLGLLAGSASLPIIKQFGEAGKIQIQSEESLLKAYKPMDMSDKEWKTYLDSSDGQSIKQQVKDYRNQQEESVQSQKTQALVGLGVLAGLALLPAGKAAGKFVKKDIFGKEILYETAPKEVQLTTQKKIIRNIELSTGEIVQVEESAVKGLGRSASTGRKMEIYKQSGLGKLIGKEPELLTREQSIKVLKKKGYEDKEIQKILRTQRPKIAIQDIEGKVISVESDLLKKPINIFKGTITETPQIIEQAGIKSRKFTPTRTYVELPSEQIGMFGETSVSYGQGIKEKVFVVPSKVNLGGGQGEFMKLSQRGKTQELFEQVGGSTGMKEGEVLQLGKSTLKKGELFIPAESKVGEGTIYGYRRLPAEGYTLSSFERTLLPKKRAISKGTSKLVDIRTEPIKIDIESPIRVKKDIKIDLGVPKKGSEVKFTKEQAKELSATLRDIYKGERGFKPPRRSPSRITFTKEQAKEITKSLREIYGGKGELELKTISQKGQTLIPQVSKIKERPIIQYKPTKVPEAYEFYPKIVGGLGKSQSLYHARGIADTTLTEPMNLKVSIQRSEGISTPQIDFQTLSYQPTTTKLKDTELFGITTKDINLLKTGQIEVTKEKQRQNQRFGNINIQKPITIERSAERTQEATKEVTGLRSGQALAQPQLLISRLANSLKPQRPKPPEFPYKRITIVPFPLMSSEPKKKTSSFKGRRQTFYPVVRRYGKFFSLGGEPTPERALAKGKQFAYTTLGASVRVKSERGFIPLQAGGQFRQSKRDSTILVQLRGQRLKSPFERIEIVRSRMGGFKL